MTTPRIEEMVEEFKDKFGVTYLGQETQDEWLRTALTEAHQAGIDEVVEKGWNYIVEATRAESWSKEDFKKALQDKK